MTVIVSFYTGSAALHPWRDLFRQQRDGLGIGRVERLNDKVLNAGCPLSAKMLDRLLWRRA